MKGALSKSCFEKLSHSTLFRHVFRHFLMVFATVNILASVFFLGLRFLSMSSALLMGISIGSLSILTLLFIPSFLTFLFPLSLYMSIYIVVSRMSSDREIVVLEGLGYRIKKLYLPFLVISATVFLLLLFNVAVVEPLSAKAVRSRVSRIMKNYRLNIKGDTFVDAFRGCVMYVGENRDGRLKDILIYKDEDGRKTLITAPEGSVERKGDGYLLHLKDGHMEVTGTYGSLDVIRFKEMVVGFSPSGRLNPKRLFALKNKEMDVITLSKMARKEKTSGNLDKARELESMVHFKFSLIISVFALSLVAFSVGAGKLPSLFSGVKGLFLFLVMFYGAFAFFQSFGITMGMDPVAMAYMPDIILLLVGGFVFTRLKE